MAERWQSSEAGRKAAGFWRDSNGAPVTGLTPTSLVQYKDNSTGAPSGTVTEVTVGGALGFYVLTLSTQPAKDVLVRLDGGSGLTTTRYIALEVPVGGYVDNVDASVSTRATSTAVSALSSAITALGSPAQATDTATLLARLTSARALLLDNLDAAVSSRSTHAEATTDTPGTTTLLSRLNATRAGLLDALTLLDIAISTRGSSTSTAEVLTAVGALGSPAQASSLTTAITTMLSEIDTRATRSDVQVTVPPSPQIQSGP